MRKALLPAALIITAAFGARLGGAFEFSCGVSHIGSSVASPLLWQVGEQVLENVLNRVLSRLASNDGPTSDAAAWSGEVAKIVIQAALEKALEGSSITETKNPCLIMSIPRYLVRRTVESGNEAAPAGAA